MRLNNFEEFLQDYFADNNPEIMDDNIPDEFDSWIEKLDLDDFIRLGQKYGEKIHKHYAKELKDILESSITGAV